MFWEPKIVNNKKKKEKDRRETPIYCPLVWNKRVNRWCRVETPCMFGQIKIDTEKYPQLASRYGVSALPTMMLFRNGNPIDKLVRTRASHRVRGIVGRRCQTRDTQMEKWGFYCYTKSRSFVRSDGDDDDDDNGDDDDDDDDDYQVSGGEDTAKVDVFYGGMMMSGS